MPKVTRREFLRVSALTAAATVAVACAQPTEEPEPTTAAAATTAPTTAAAATTAPVVSSFSEAPMLAEMVEAGTLPAVEDRLPENPCVCPVMESVGNYGGTLRRGFKGTSDGNGPSKLINEGLTWYTPELALRANLCESWEINDDATVWTVTLRAGTKYSDGTPFTTEWVKWYWDNVQTYTDITSTPSERWGWGSPRVAADLGIVDDFTFTLTYGEPKPLLAFEFARNIPQVPGFYLEQFHPAFNDAATLQAAAEALGLSSPTDYWSNRESWRTNPEVPLLFPWTPETDLSVELHIMNRNPYFWQVDESGQQLPYIDKIQHRLYETIDVFNMWIVNGEIDMQNRSVDIGNYTLFKESEASGDYKVALGISASHDAIQLNLTTKNEPLREFFNILDVRKAFMLAINREEINELVYDGQCTPRQYSPLSASPQYYEALTNGYIEYDPETAKSLLDGAGYLDTNGDGFREYPDGSTLSFTIEGTDSSGSVGEDVALLAIGYLNAIGINCAYKYNERSLYTEHYEANEIEAANWGGDRSVLPIVAPWIFIGSMTDRPWCAAWAIYWNNNKDATYPNAEEPPAGHWIWDIWDNHAAMVVEADEEARNQYFKNILDIWVEQVPMIGILGEKPAPCIVKNGLQNVAFDGQPVDDTIEDEHLHNTQTYFWDVPADHS